MGEKYTSPFIHFYAANCHKYDLLSVTSLYRPWLWTLLPVRCLLSSLGGLVLFHSVVLWRTGDTSKNYHGNILWGSPLELQCYECFSARSHHLFLQSCSWLSFLSGMNIFLAPNKKEMSHLVFSFQCQVGKGHHLSPLQYQLLLLFWWYNQSWDDAVQLA